MLDTRFSRKCLTFEQHLNYFLAIRQREADITKERVEKILASGANVILTTGGIDDLNTKYFVERGAMGVRRVLKKDMKRIAKACGGEFFILPSPFF